MPVSGYVEEVKRLTPADLTAFYKKYYVPNNAVLIVAGDTSADEVRKLAERHYGPIAKKPVDSRRRPSSGGTELPQRLIRADARVAEARWARDYLAPLLVGSWWIHHLRGELKVALPLAEELENFGKTHDNSSALLLGKVVRGTTCLFLGELTTARALLEQCDALGEPAHRAVLAPWIVNDQYVQTLVFLAVILATQGYIEQGRARLNAALRRWR